jgi:hypothetical protein
LLCNSSAYFKAALNNGFSETTTQKITLDDDDPDVFRTYAAWLFEHEITLESLQGVVGDFERHLFYVYIFADKRGVVGLTNDVVTMLASSWTCTCVDMDITVECLPLISSQSTLYQLSLDSLIIDIRASWWDLSHWDELCRHSKEIIAELFKRERAFPRDFDQHSHCIEAICHYHQHSDDEEEKDKCVEKTERGLNCFATDRLPEKQIEWSW